MLLKIFVLVCPLTMAHADCQRDTAVDVVRSVQVRNEVMCGFMGQAQMASASDLVDPKTQYVKVVCVPVREQSANGAIFQR